MRGQFFSFPELQDTNRLKFDFLKQENRHLVLEMFRDDKSKFVDDVFKIPDKVDYYVYFLEVETKYSKKNAGCDWIIFDKENSKPLGLLHLFGLCLGENPERNRRCSIGFSICEKYRQRGYAAEAVANLVTYIFSNFEIDNILAYTRKSNHPSQSFLLKIGFVPSSKKYLNVRGLKYFELGRLGV